VNASREQRNRRKAKLGSEQNSAFAGRANLTVEPCAFSYLFKINMTQGA